jgi:hypothetical protein
MKDVHKISLMDPILSQMDPIHECTYYLKFMSISFVLGQYSLTLILKEVPVRFLISSAKSNTGFEVLTEVTMKNNFSGTNTVKFGGSYYLHLPPASCQFRTEYGTSMFLQGVTPQKTLLCVKHL